MVDVNKSDIELEQAVSQNMKGEAYKDEIFFRVMRKLIRRKMNLPASLNFYY